EHASRSRAALVDQDFAVVPHDRAVHAAVMELLQTVPATAVVVNAVEPQAIVVFVSAALPTDDLPARGLLAGESDDSGHLAHLPPGPVASPGPAFRRNPLFTFQNRPPGRGRLRRV